MTACPVCGNVVTLASAIRVTIDRGGVYGQRVTCPTCGAVYSATTVIIKESPLTIDQLAKIRSQPRG